MIIDFHAHLMGDGYPSNPFWEGFVRISSALSGRPPEVVRARLPDLWDPEGENLISAMDQCGMDKAVLIVADWGLCPNLPEEVDLWEQHLMIHRASQAHPGRFILFAGVDPRRPGAAELLERAVKELGAQGLKIHPAAGFFPHDRVAWPLYAKALELGIPVMVHTGPEVPPLYSRFCQPVFVDDVAADFPDLTIIMAHAGLGWWQDAAAVASSKPNVYLDLAGWQPLARRHPLDFYRALRAILDATGPGRVLFGSDWPVLRLLMTQERWLRAFLQPPPAIEEAGIRFKEEELRAITGETAAQLLGLN